MPAGEYYLEVQSGRKILGIRENFLASTVFAVGQGEERTLSLTARHGGFLRLHLQLPEADPLTHWRGLQVETDVLDPPQPPTRMFGAPTENGYVRGGFPPTGSPALSRFSAGSHRFTIRADGFQPVHVSAVIRPGEITDVEVPMQRR